MIGLRAGLSASVLAALLAATLACAAVAATTALLGAGPAVVLGVTALAAIVTSVLFARAALAPSLRTLEALWDGVRGFRERDFSLRLAVDRDDQLGRLVQVYNEIGDVLRAERREIFQRELLLDTVVQGTPTGLLLVSAAGRIVFANRAARDLFGGGPSLEGHALAALLEACPPAFRGAFTGRGPTLLTLEFDGSEETFRIADRRFELHGQPHTLWLVERLTPELRRREVETWKSAIRVMNHELNNSLAPIRSLVSSARRLEGHPDRERLLGEIFDTIADRTEHLTRFLEGYARFARLPAPNPAAVDWAEFLEAVRRLCPFRLDGALPSRPGWFDAAQLQQVLINLLKNAQESGSGAEEIAVAVRDVDGGFVVQVRDRGRGMDAEVIRRALLPFYSTKASGTGIGLPLCNEILESHGGRLQIASRPGEGTTVTCWLPARA